MHETLLQLEGIMSEVLRQAPIPWGYLGYPSEEYVKEAVMKARKILYGT